MNPIRTCTGCRYLAAAQERPANAVAKCLGFGFTLITVGPDSGEFRKPDECNGPYFPREETTEALIDSKVAYADQMRQALNQQRAFINAVLDKVKERLAEGSCDEEDDRIISLAADHNIGNVRRVKYDPRIHGVMDCEPGQEVYWWGNPKTDEELRSEFMEDAPKWVCDCGQHCNPASPAWRWNGEFWEHHHGGQAGHFPARKP